MDSDVESVVSSFQDESDDFSPMKPKAKAAAKKATAAKPAAKAAPKKMVQTTLKSKAAPKKRAKPESDKDDDDDEFDGDMSNTPPNAKKQKTAAKKGGGKPLGEIENDSFMQLDVPSEQSKTTKKKTATETYQKLSQIEHIIKRPDTYIGSVERTEIPMWTFDKEKSLMKYKKPHIVPGFYKIFDEILVNAADNKQRDKNMSYIKIAINREDGEISVENDGKGIPVEMHDKENIYIPELVFGHLLAGSNFDDNEKKTVGGRNGYGAKLCNVFSTEFTLECQDSVNCKRYKTTWRDNMGKMDKPKITSNKAKDFVRVTFKPDWKKFGMENGIDDDTEAVLYRRVYDLAGTVDGVKVYLNGEHLKVGWKKYCEMYAKSIAEERQDIDEDGTGPKPATVIFEDIKAHGGRWQIGFTVSDGSFQQVSFVNSIATTAGGTHVNYIADQICTALLKDLSKKMKGHSLKNNHIRNHIFIFVNCLIDNPAFTSQTKEQMTTKASAFGSKCVLTDGFIKKIRATDAINNIMHFAEKKADKLMAKTDGNKRSRISNEKLVDANLAGTRHGHECTLILTEGDSARGLAVAGRAILDPDRIGVFPLRGKMLNVRDAPIDQILKNAEVNNIKQFLGLKHKTTYTDTKSLRYGHLMIMADQDHDGSHIKGLLINFLQVQYPSLLQIPDFFREFTTPVVKVWQGPNPKKPLKLRSFFTMPEYEAWKERHANEIKKWHYKYFKGLGTSSNEDAQVYFTDLDNHLKEFDIMKPEETDLFDLAFSKKKADARKEWLGNFVPGTFLDHSTKQISYTDFVNRELILFSMADNLRSIPSVVDGLKPGQRKVVFACFKRNLTKDKKVVELAGYVSEQTAYHHGEASLQQTIIGLAQTFVGSNNVNILEPSGNFGSRLAGGSDAASARYIFTRLSPFARRIFSPLDEPILEAQFEDGKQIEPKTYAPVLPMVLCNGADGIGTGWSTSIPNYHPMDIIENIKRRMGRHGDSTEELPFQTMTPWFRGWKGQAEPEGPGRYKFNGIARIEKDNEVLVTELPIRMWTDDFKAKLETVIRGEKAPSYIKDYKEFNDHRNVHFEIQLDEKVLKKSLEENELLEKFKLAKSIGTTNLVAFDPRGQIRKYENVEQILEEFYLYRYALYTDRRTHWLKVLDDDYEKLKNMARFIQEIIDGKLVVSKKKKAVLIQELRDKKYRPFPKGETNKKKVKNTDEEMDQEEEADPEEEEVDAGVPGANDFDYLLSMQIYSLTLERLERLKKQIAAKKAEKDELEALNEKDLWIRDLDAFVEEWENQMRLDDEIRNNIRKMGRRVSKKIGAGKGGKRKNDDDDFMPGKGKGRPVVKKVNKIVAPAVTTSAQSRFMSTFAKPSTKKAVTADGADDSDEDFTASFGRESKKPTPAPTAAPAKKPDLMDLDDDDEFAALEEPKAKALPARRAAKKIAPIVDLSESDFDDENDFAESEEPGPKAAPAKKTSGDLSDESDEFVEAEEPKPKAALAKRAAKKPIVDLSDDDDFADLEETKPEPKAAPVKKSVKKPSPVVDLSDDDEFAEPEEPKPKAAAAKRAAKKPIVNLSDDDEVADLQEPQPKAAPAKKPIKKTSPIVDLSDDDDDDDDDNDDLAAPIKARGKGKSVPVKKASPVESEPEETAEPEEESKPTNGRSKRAAASKAKKTWTFDDSEEESESDGDNMIGDVGAMVRGIGEPAADATNGRLSLFAMSRSEHGNTAMPKLKTKQSRTLFDDDNVDDTNYELLAKSSPQKTTKSSDIDMSEDEEALVTAKASAAKAKQGKVPLNVVSAPTKGKGRAAGAKKEAAPVKKPTQLSPAAKAYAAKAKSTAAASKAGKKTGAAAFDFSDSEEEADEDGDVAMEDSPPAKPAARGGRPGRAAATKKKTYALPSDDDEDMSDADVYAVDSD